MKLSIALISVILVGANSLGSDVNVALIGSGSYLEITLENRTGELIDQAADVFGKSRCNSGRLGMGASSTYVGLEKPVGTNACVRWRDGKGGKHDMSVSLVGLIIPGSNGRLIFTIGGTNASTDVAVRFAAMNPNSRAKGGSP